MLAVCSDRKIAVTSSSDNWLFEYYRADVYSVTDYDPFGMVLAERSWAQEEYRFGFNGKENDAEWEAQDYGMREYSARLGRFFSADPLIVYAQAYAELSSYQFASNTPIWAIDLDGLEAKKATKTTGDAMEVMYGLFVDMTHAPRTGKYTNKGAVRNAPWFWKQILHHYPMVFSPDNIDRINRSVSPLVDDQWVKYFPNHGKFMNQKIEHHHVEHGNWATAMPEEAH